MFQKEGSSPYPIILEAKILTVDITRGVCKCRTDRGQELTDVRWGYPLGQHKERGDNSHPVPEERVLIISVRGERYVFMSVGSPQVSEASTRSSISRGRGLSGFHNKLNNSLGNDLLRREGSTPTEMLPGDKIYTGERGTLFGMLKGGTFIAKASGLAQLIISRLDDIFRIVSRNYEMFSDAMTHYSVNLRGRVYSYIGHYKTQSSSRVHSPDYYEVFGDVAAGEVAKENYLEKDLVLGALDSIVKLQRIPAKDGSGEAIGTVWLSTYNTDGKRVETASTFDLGVKCVITSENGHWRVDVEGGGGTASIDVTPTEIKSLVGSCEIKQTPDSVEITTSNSVKVNTTNATINTTNATLNATTATLTALTSATIESPSVTVATAAFTLSAAGGGSSTASITNCAISATGCIITGDAASDVKIAGVSLKNHSHTGNLGVATSPPTPVP